LDELPLVSPLERAVFLRAQPYFDGLDPAVIAVLASHTREHRARAGEVLFDEARSVRRVSFIVEGCVRTVLEGETLFEIDAPGGVGLAHGLARGAMPPTAIAVTDCLTLQIEFDAFLQILEDHFSLVLQIARIFSRLILDSERKTEAPPPRSLPPSSDATALASLDLVHRMAWARRSPIFHDANLAVVAELMRATEEVRLEKDDWLWRAHSDADAIALLVDGTLCLDAGPSPSQIPSQKPSQIGPGSLVGFAELFGERPRERSARAEEPCVLLRADRSAVVDAMEDHFDLALDFLNAFATRHLALWAPRALRGDNRIDRDIF
jgi:CRP-like cAMP-binding protein